MCSKNTNICRLTARVQYTEEKAKRALVSSDLQNTTIPASQSKSMLTAKRVLSLEQEVASLTNSKRELTQKMSRRVQWLQSLLLIAVFIQTRCIFS